MSRSIVHCSVLHESDSACSGLSFDPINLATLVGARPRNRDWRNRLLSLHFNARFDREEDVRIGWSIVKWRAPGKRAGNLGHDTRMLRRIQREVCTKPCQERASEIISLPVIRERFIEAVRGGLAASHTSSSSSTSWGTACATRRICRIGDPIDVRSAKSTHISRKPPCCSHESISCRKSISRFYPLYFSL